MVQSANMSSPFFMTALIGLHDSKENGEWQWADESQFDYTNWNLYEPNGKLTNEFCVETVSSLDIPDPRRPNMKHAWNDIPCNHTKAAAICAYKGKHVSFCRF